MNYVGATTFVCRICGGPSTVTRAEPYGDWHKCPHHGVGSPGDGDEGGFAHYGVGHLGDEFRFETFAVLDANEGDVPHHRRPSETDLREVRERRFEDYEAVVVHGLTPPEQARERGVTGGTVRANVDDARVALVGVSES